VTDEATSPLPPFLRACRGIPGGPGDRVPVWFMRQAGRSLPEYRSIRGSGSILDAIADPELSAEITMQPVRRYDVDAAILYSDIVVPVAAIGFGVDVAPGIGPVVEQPFTRAADLERLRPLDPEADTPYVLETVRILARELPVPLIGFAGAPFTVASYLIEGQPSRTYTRTKALMYGDTNLWHKLMERLSDLAIVSLRSQIENGAVALQIFDSWAGTLSAPDYEKFVLPASWRRLAPMSSVSIGAFHLMSLEHACRRTLRFKETLILRLRLRPGMLLRKRLATFFAAMAETLHISSTLVMASCPKQTQPFLSASSNLFITKVAAMELHHE